MVCVSIISFILIQTLASEIIFFIKVFFHRKNHWDQFNRCMNSLSGLLQKHSCSIFFGKWPSFWDVSSFWNSRREGKSKPSIRKTFMIRAILSHFSLLESGRIILSRHYRCSTRFSYHAACAATSQDFTETFVSSLQPPGKYQILHLLVF